jgi:hypothetical protein
MTGLVPSCGMHYLKTRTLVDCTCERSKGGSGICPVAAASSTLTPPEQGHQWWTYTKPAPCIHCGLLYEDYSLAHQRAQMGSKVSMKCPNAGAGSSSSPSQRRIVGGIIIDGPFA